jgi:hypothetical protein
MKERVRRRSRLAALVTVAVLATTVPAATAEGTHRQPVATHVVAASTVPVAPRLTVAAALKRLVGTAVTDKRLGARSKIIGWVRYYRHGRLAGWSAKVRTARIVHCSSARTAGAHCPGRRVAGAPRPVTITISPGRTYPRQHWWDPRSWPWHDLFNAAWTRVVRPCAQGVLTAVVGVKTTDMSARLLMKRGYLAKSAARKAIFGPGAVPALVLGGCTFGIVSQLWQ